MTEIPQDHDDSDENGNSSDNYTAVTGTPGRYGFVEFEPETESDREPSGRRQILRYPSTKSNEYVVPRQPLGRRDFVQRDSGHEEPQPQADE